MRTSPPPRADVRAPARSGSAAVVLLGLALLLAGAPARAEDEAGTPGFTVSAQIENTPEGGVLSIEGLAPKLPDGALLHVTLCVRGKFPSPIEAAFFQVRVSAERFSARKTFPNQTFAALPYWIRVELFLNNQRKAVRDWISREYGVSRRAQLLLARQDLEVGTPAEQAEFRRKTLVDLREFVARHLALYDQVSAAIDPAPDANPGWGEAQSKIAGDLGGLSKELQEYLLPHVVWHEKHSIGKVESAAAEMGWAVRAYGSGAHLRAKQALAQVQLSLDRLLHELDSRLPRRAAEGDEDEKDDESEEEPK